MGSAEAFASALVSAGAHPSIPPNQRIFEPFIGSWDLVVTWYQDGDLVRSENGEWHFAHILEGRGIEDVWIVPPRGERERHPDPYEYGVSVRFYDPAVDGWRSTWHGPQHGLVRSFVARRSEDGVMLETTLESGRRMRWSFSDIAPASFTWTNRSEEADGGWRLDQMFKARRAGSR